MAAMAAAANFFAPLEHEEVAAAPKATTKKRDAMSGAAPRALQWRSDPAKAPSGARLLSFATYNVLADCYARASYFPSIQRKALQWDNRRRKLLGVLDKIDADVVCLQEVDHWSEFWLPALESRGYGGVLCKRTGKKKDGCALFYKRDCFEVVAGWKLEFNSLGDGMEPTEAERFTTDNVAQVYALRLLDGPQKGAILVVGNAHLFWNPAHDDVKQQQADLFSKYLLAMGTNPTPEPPQHLDGEAHVDEGTPRCHAIIACGDFNALPGSPVHNFMCSRFASAYASVMSGEPEVTNYRDSFQGTLDYIFLQQPRRRAPARVQPVAVRRLPCGAELKKLGYSPNMLDPSDHWPVAVELQLV